MRRRRIEEGENEDDDNDVDDDNDNGDNDNDNGDSVNDAMLDEVKVKKSSQSPSRANGA